MSVWSLLAVAYVSGAVSAFGNLVAFENADPDYELYTVMAIGWPVVAGFGFWTALKGRPGPPKKDKKKENG